MRIRRFHCNGEECALQFFLAKSTKSNPTTYFWYGDRRVDLDDLPVSLDHLVPVPIIKSKAKDWEPFVQRALELGVF